ncbi:MAG: hypothetical protein AAB492_05710 [Patescibacteria group bacterium]
MIKTISAYEARKNFGELMNLAYYKDYEIIVEKMGKPMIKITKVAHATSKAVSRSEIMAKYLGVWDAHNSKEIVTSAKFFRKSFKIFN